MNEFELQQFGDPETLTRIAQYELAYRMQIAVPSVMDISQETAATLEMYGAQPGAASFANNCLQARRLVERGSLRPTLRLGLGHARHGAENDLVTGLPKKCKEVDQPIAALVRDLKGAGTARRDAGHLGRRIRSHADERRAGRLEIPGRDHHPHCFSIWMAGGGVNRGFSLGETDDFSYFVTQDAVPVNDLQATVLHCLGLDPHQLGYKYQGLHQRLIGPTSEPRVRRELLA